MNKNLEHYVRVFNLIDSDVCVETTKQLQSVEWEKHMYRDPTNERDVTYDDDLFISNDRITNKELLMKLTWQSFLNYIEELELPWLAGWHGHSEIRFNRYDVDTQMRIHCDHIHTLFDGNRKGIPVMTALGLLNNDYEGGEFIMFGDTQINLKAGDIIVFPSNYLYPHQVNPVKSGVRYSFVSWAW